jgi:hypothetical protein
MKEGQQRRWAKIRGEAESSSSAVTPEPAKPKRKLSAAGKAAIVAALKKRWAAKRVAAKTAAKATSVRKAAVKMAAVKKAQKKAVRVPETAATPAVK